MGLIRTGFRLGKRALLSGPGAGAFLLSLLFVTDLLGASLDFMGFSDEKATRYIIGRYGPHIVLNQLEILAIYAVVGALFGTLGDGIGRLWDWARMRSTSRARRVLRGAGAAILGHALVLVRHLVHYPQLYTEWLYDRGGARRAIMVALTDHLSVLALDLLLVTVLLALVGGPLLMRRGRTRIAYTFRRTPPSWAIAAGLVALLAATATWVGLRRRVAAAAQAGTRPNVLVLAVDSLRADRVYAPDATKRFPTLATLAARGVRFREAHVTVPRTFPSFVTLLTGRWPHRHGIRHMFPTAAARRAIGPALPSALSQAGWHTSVYSDYAGEIFSRTPLGFEVAEVPYFDMKTIVEQRGLQVHPNVLPYATGGLGRRLFPAVDALPERSDPALLADRAIAALGRMGDRPFFMTLFFSAAHFPYAAPPPFYQRFSVPGYAGPFRYQKPPLATAAVTPTDAAQIRGLYDGAVAAADAAIARVLAQLRATGLDRNTIVVLLADHGENLYDIEGRGMGHGDHLHGSAADHVPLVIVDPRRPASRDVPGIVRDVDLAPTLAALVGCKAPPTDGVDLGPLLRGDQPSLGLDAYGETEFWFTDNGPGFQPDERLPYPGITGATALAEDGDIYIRPEWQDTIVVAKHRAIRTERHKLVYRPTRAGAQWQLYDVVADPEERVDLAARQPDVARALRIKLEAWMTSDGHTVMRGGFAVPVARGAP